MFGRVAMLWALCLFLVWNLVQDYIAYVELYDACLTCVWLPATYHVCNVVPRSNLVGNQQDHGMAG